VNNPGDLYSLPLDRFIPERGSLAKALRGEGRKDDAARVAALRKPSVAAWTVNQLIRSQARQAGALFDAGDELQRVQSALLAGRGDSHALREATQSERQAVDELVEAARGLLSSGGHEPSQATLDRVSETLHAAALDEDARSRVSAGCLERELRWAGFGARSDADPGRAERSDPGRAEQAERARAEQAARDRAEKLRSAREAEDAARRLVERTARELQTAQELRDRAAVSLSEAEEALVAAHERAEEASLAHERARMALGRLEPSSVAGVTAV